MSAGVPSIVSADSLEEASARFPKDSCKGRLRIFLGFRGGMSFPLGPKQKVPEWGDAYTNHGPVPRAKAELLALCRCLGPFGIKGCYARVLLIKVSAGFAEVDQACSGMFRNPNT